MEPELHPQHKTMIIAVSVIAALILGALVVYFLLGFFPGPPEPPVIPEMPTPQEELLERGAFTEFPEAGDIISQQGVSNPAEAFPKDNPFETTTNPFDDAYKNPFE